MTYTPIWPRYQIDNQGTGKCSYPDPSLSTYWIYSGVSVAAYGTIASQIIVNYNSATESEVAYFITTKKYLFALDIKNKIPLWSPKSLSIFPSYTTISAGYLVLSNDGETIYCSGFSFTSDPEYQILEAINTSNGLTKWTYIPDKNDFASPSHGLCIIGSPLLDTNEKIHIKIMQLTGINHIYIFTLQDNETEAVLVDHGDISASKSVYSSSYVASGTPTIIDNNSNNLYYGFAYVGSSPPYHSAVCKTNLNATGYTDNVLVDIYARNGDNENIHGLIYEDPDIIYATSSVGLYKINFIAETASLLHYDSLLDYSKVSQPAIMGNYIYYRVGTKLFKINKSTGAAEWSSNILSSNCNISPIINNNNLIYITSDNAVAGQPNLQIFSEDGFVAAHSLLNSPSRYIQTYPGNENLITPVFGSTSSYYIPFYNFLTSSTSLAVLGNPVPPTTTTTTSSTTTLAPTTTTTTSTGTGTTTTTTPTTTTTTTTPAPLSVVETYEIKIVNTSIVGTESSNASNSVETLTSPFAKALSFGTIAPGETSRTLIIQLNIPNVRAISNIKLALIDTDDLIFNTSMFGINYSVELRDDITPDFYFQGVNTDKLSTNAYNISIPNKDNYNSSYVYLNLNLPNDYTIKTGMLRFMWFFDYSD